jgi:hypothetical protein
MKIATVLGVVIATFAAAEAQPTSSGEPEKPRNSMPAEAQKNATGMTPEEFGAAQDAQAARRCFEVVMPGNGGTARYSVLLNRCNGDTWVLDIVTINKDGSKVWRWISIEKSMPR